jgi:hypothetical protein
VCFSRGEVDGKRGGRVVVVVGSKWYRRRALRKVGIIGHMAVLVAT